MSRFIPRGFPKEMWVIFAGDVITSLGMSMVFIFLSIYFNVVLGISMTILGIIWMVTDISSFFSQIIGGALADHFGRKRLMEISLLFRGVIWIAIGFIDNAYILAALVIISRPIASLCWPAATAMVTDIIPSEKRIEAFGLWRMGGNLGWGLGAMIGGLLATISYKVVFFAGGISNIIFGILVIIMLKETLPKKIDVDEMEGKAKGMLKNVCEYKSVLKDTRFFLFTMLGVLIAFIYSQSNTTMPVYLIRETIIDTKQLGYIWALNGWAIVVFQMMITEQLKKYKFTIMLSIGSLIYAISFLVLLNARNFPHILIFMSVFTIAEMIISPIEMAFVANVAPEDKRGRYMGFYSLTWGLGGAMGKFVGGSVMDTLPTRILWYLMASVCMVALFGYLSLGKIFKMPNSIGDDCT